MNVCNHCEDLAKAHQDEHENLCCDCFNLSCGEPLAQINAERKKRGEYYELRRYPGRRKDGTPTLWSQICRWIASW